MTPGEMAEALRAAGWRVYPPPDLLVAEPWEQPRAGQSARRRCWRDTVTVAAYVDREAPCGRHHGCECRERWSWSARLSGSRGREGARASGWADCPEEAMARADEALLRLLREAREARLRRAPVHNPGEPLGLPVEER